MNFEDAASSTLISGTQVRELPLNNRNYEQLVSLQPGVSYGGGDQLYIGLSNPAGETNAVSFSINGNRNSANNWTLDGADNVDRGSNLTLLAYLRRPGSRRTRHPGRQCRQHSPRSGRRPQLGTEPASIPALVQHRGLCSCSRRPRSPGQCASRHDQRTRISALGSFLLQKHQGDGGVRISVPRGVFQYLQPYELRFHQHIDDIESLRPGPLNARSTHSAGRPKVQLLETCFDRQRKRRTHSPGGRQAYVPSAIHQPPISNSWKLFREHSLSFLRLRSLTIHGAFDDLYIATCPALQSFACFIQNALALC